MLGREPYGEDLEGTHQNGCHAQADQDPSPKGCIKELPKAKRNAPKAPISMERGDHNAGAYSIEHWSHWNLKQGKGVKESASEYAQGFCIEPQILGEVGSDDGIGNPIKHGKGIEGGKNGKD